MKKRIISLILVVVMLSLSLVGCAYSYEDDDLAQYVTYDEKAFQDALKSLVIVDGDFTEDNETRNKKVHDAIISALASNATDTKRYDTGKPGQYDKFYYCYYITFVDDAGKTVYLAPDVMATGKAKNIQFGKAIYSTTLEEAVYNAAKDYEFTAEKSYSQTSSGKVEAGQLAAVTYTVKYNPDGNGIKTVTATLEIGALSTENPIHAKLLEKNSIGTKLDSFTIAANSGLVINGETINAEITVEGAKVDYVIKGEQLTTITEKTYAADSTTVLKDIYGNEHKVADKELTYNVYAYRFSRVDELNAANIIKLIYGKNFTQDIAKEIMILGNSLKDKTEDEQKAFFDDFKVNGIEAVEGSNVFETLVDKIVTALNDVETKKTTKTTAESALSSAETAYQSAKEEAEANPDSESAKAELKEAEKTKNEKQDAVNKAATALEEAEATRDELVAALLTKDYKVITDAKEAYKNAKADEATKKAEAEKEGATDEAKAAYETAKKATEDAKAAYDAKVYTTVEGVNEIIVKGYTDLKYEELQEAYRADKQNKIVVAVLEQIKKNVKVNSYPEKAVDEAYDKLINNYKYNFYNGKATGSDGKTLKDENGVEITNYTKYNGSFKNYLVAAVTTDYAEVKTYKEAKEALRAWAQEKVAPVLQFSFIADKYDVVYTDEEFKEYKKDKNNAYESDEYYYGESTVRNGLQFEKLMDYFLASTEKVDENDARFVKDVYTNIGFAQK